MRISPERAALLDKEERRFKSANDEAGMAIRRGLVRAFESGEVTHEQVMATLNREKKRRRDALRGFVATDADMRDPSTFRAALARLLT